MNYRDAIDGGSPIGPGPVEATNKVLVAQRMKRAGQSWERDGGQGVLSARYTDQGALIGLGQK